MTHPVFEFANPNGRPDSVISENEARLWLLSQADRAHGAQVVFDDDSQRWVVRGAKQAASVVCEACGKGFEALRSTAKYCSDKCKKRGSRRP